MVEISPNSTYITEEIFVGCLFSRAKKTVSILLDRADQHHRRANLHPRDRLRPNIPSASDTTRLDPIFFFCMKQHGATRATTAADFQEWSKEQGCVQNKDRREEKKQQWQGRSKPAPKQCPKSTQVRHHEPKSGLWWPHFAVWPNQRIHSVSIKSADRTNTCPLPRTSRAVGHVSRGRAR